MTRRKNAKEEGLNDPLANVEQFNIIQFLSAENEFALPIDDNLDPNNPVLAGQMKHEIVEDNNPTLFQLTGRLPDSPPITDISGNGSSASPSSNSDEPYSPDFQNYPGLAGGRRIDSSGLILGVNDAQAGVLRSAFECRKFENRTNQQLSPTETCFMSPYPQSQQPTPRSYVQSVSPEAQNENRSYTANNLYNALNVSSDGSINSQGSDPPNRKRSRLDVTLDPTAILNAALLAHAPNVASPVDSYMGEDNFSQPVIKFNKFQEDSWSELYDCHGRIVKQLQVNVIADKGFNYSANDGCFVNQKKNHFQITVSVEASDSMPPSLIRYKGGLVPITDFKLSFCGVKSEMTTSEVCIKQSRTDRKPHPHMPVNFEIQERRMTKVTVPRLHFSETTLNNQRKNLRPNPEQKYFLLVVRLCASIGGETPILVQSYASEKVIVRATNPGSFEPPDSDVGWNKNGGTMFSSGPVAVGTERAIGKLTVDGDIYTTGKIISPSDIRLKENITDKEAREALDNLCKLRIVDYFYKPEVAEKWGLTEKQRKRTGVIAQELAAVLPDAVKDIGDYLTVNESRVFYETVLATQELCRLTGDLDQKIDDKVEEISQRLAKYAARKKILSSLGSNLDGKDKKSTISQSQFSLVSSVSQYRERRKSRRSSSRDKGVCGSRLAQGTIMMLVGIMAFCLLTMSGLYVLDWHNRNYGYHHVYVPTQSTPKEPPANMVMSPSRGVPHWQPDAPPIMPNCISLQCKNYCCPENVDENQESEEFNEETYFETVSRSTFKNKDFGTGVTIQLPEYRMDIDTRYCVEKSCNKRLGVFNLFIPISKYYPNLPLEVLLKTPKSKLVSNCGYVSYFVNKQCSDKKKYVIDDDTEYPASSQIVENLFELDVGDYIQSAYRFRVGYVPETCYAQEPSNGAYEEYNLFFYRQCNTNMTSTASV